jgi:hypothetical protein
VTASDPKRVRTSSRAVSRAVPLWRSKGRVSWMTPLSSRLATAMPTSVMPWRSIIGMAVATSERAVARIVGAVAFIESVRDAWCRRVSVRARSLI